MKLQSFRIMVFVLTGVFFLGISSVYTETIVLKSGNTIEGKIIEKTDKYIKIDFEGVPLTYFYNEIASIDKSSVEETAVFEKKQEEKKTSIGKSPSDFKTQGKEKIRKNDSDDIWEMTIKGIEPMYDDPDPKRGKSQKEMDETVLKVVIQELGSREAAIVNIIESAWIYFNSGYPNIAMRKFNQAWSLDSKNAEVYFGFGCILTNRKDLGGAIKMYTKAVDLNPKYYEAYANRGLDYCGKEAYDKAILDFTKAIEIRPNEAQTYNDRAVTYFFLEEYSKCWADVNKAIELGYRIHPEFLKELKKASGRDK